MKIGDKEFKEIIVTTKDDELIALINDENIVEEKDFKVICVPCD
jgi:hypothetical protein